MEKLADHQAQGAKVDNLVQSISLKAHIHWGELCLFSFLHKRSPNILGLDITSSAVKLLELGRAGQLFRVESYGVYP